jgi:CheY-like chemotaxis protein
MSTQLNVLLVDDDPSTRHLFETVLGYHDFQLKTAQSEDEALKYLASNNPDIIVLDIVLPGKDGYKVLKTLRTVAKSNCPIVATTAYYTTDSIPDFEQRGFDGYLLKPITPENLVSYLEKMTQNN